MGLKILITPTPIFGRPELEYLACHSTIGPYKNLDTLAAKVLPVPVLFDTPSTASSSRMEKSNDTDAVPISTNKRCEVALTRFISCAAHDIYARSAVKPGRENRRH